MKIQGVDHWNRSDFSIHTKTKPEEKNNSQWDGKEVSVSISEEGYKSYRESLLQMGKSENNVESIFKDKDELIAFCDKVTIPGNYSAKLFDLVRELNDQDKKNETYNVKGVAGNCVEAYATLYDEIIQRYKDGVEVYVRDNTNELGYRKLTKEEELEELDRGYKGLTVFVEETYKANVDTMKHLERYYKRMQALLEGRYNMATSYIGRAYLEGKKNEEEEVPENISERILKAGKNFRMNYVALGQKKGTVAQILSSIKVW